MDWLSSFFPCFFVAMLGLIGWSFYEQSRFTRVEGDIKRGLMVWAEPLSWETRQALEALLGTTTYNDGFIRKEGSEVLVAARRSFWQAFFSRRNRLTYVGYVDLRLPQPQLEWRVAWSTLVSLVVGMAFLLVILFSFFLIPLQKGFQLSFECVFPLIFLAIFVGSIWFNHYRERKRLWDILNRAME